MDQLVIGHRRDGVRRRRLAGLRQPLAQFGFGPVQCARQPIGDLVIEIDAREDKTP